MVQKYPFDFVIGSVHLIHGMDPYYGEIFEGEKQMKKYTPRHSGSRWRTWDKIDDFDVLGAYRLCGPVRKKRKAAHYSYRKFADQIDEILRKVIDMGKGN